MVEVAVLLRDVSWKQRMRTDLNPRVQREWTHRSTTVYHLQNTCCGDPEQGGVLEYRPKTTHTDFFAKMKADDVLLVLTTLLSLAASENCGAGCNCTAGVDIAGSSTSAKTFTV